MTDEEARLWVRERFGVPRETQLSHFEALLRVEAARQNLVSRASLDGFWARHIVDSAQLLTLVPDDQSNWLDIGSGAGLPGMVTAILSDRPTTLVEPRGRRVEFLSRVADELGLVQVNIVADKVERHRPSYPAAVISARAVAELSTLLAAAAHCADSSTIWVLPKGRNAQSEVDAARRSWHGVFHVEPSITQAESGIVVARKVRRR